MREKLKEASLKFARKYSDYLKKWGIEVPPFFYFYLAERWAEGYKKLATGKSRKIVG
jgi:hypothetical protein